MALVEEMQSLVHEIVHSYEDRIKVIPQLKRAEDERERAAAQEISQRRSAVGAMLKGFDDAHAAMGREVRASLAQGTARLKAEGQELRGSLAQGLSHLQSEVDAMLQAVRQDIAGARNEWRKLSAAAHSRRGGPAPEGASPSSGMAGLGDRAFQYLANRPKGAKMTELEQALGAPRIQMAKALKGLAEANKVKKQDLLYFAA